MGCLVESSDSQTQPNDYTTPPPSAPYNDLSLHTEHCGCVCLLLREVDSK